MDDVGEVGREGARRWEWDKRAFFVFKGAKEGVLKVTEFC